MSKKLTIIPYRIDFANSLADCFCVILGSLGMSDKCITKNTGLTPGQIHTRLRMAKVSRKAYRNGETMIAKAVVARSRSAAEEQVNHIAQLIRGKTGMDVRALGRRIVLMDQETRDLILANPS